MATIQVLDGNGVLQTVQVPDADGRAAAASSKPMVLSNEDFAQLVVLPTGAATSAKQPALGTAGVASVDVITVQGIASGIAQPVSGTVTVGNASLAVTGPFFQTTQPVSGAVSVTPANSTLPDQSLAEQLAQLNGGIRATVHLLGQILAVSRGQVDAPPSDEADTLIGEYLNRANQFNNLIN